MDITQVVGENVRRIRVRKCISQEKLASLCNFSRPCLERIERGEKNLKVEFVERLANALGVSAVTLIDENQKDEDDLNPVETLDMDLFEYNKEILLKNLVQHIKECIAETFNLLIFQSIVKSNDSNR